MSYNIASIRKLLKAAFSDEELVEFCQNFFPDVYGNFAVEMSRLWKIQLLIDYCDRREMFGKLLDHIKSANSTQYEKYIASIGIPSPSLKKGNSSSTSQVEISFRGSWPSLEPVVLDAAVGALADILDIPRHQVRILEMWGRSIVLKVEMPTEAVDRLVALYEISSPEIQDLGIQRVKPLVPFTNQEDILRDALSSFAPPYHLIDAPAGYGKTELLLELRRRFQEQEWACAYVSADEHKTLKELVAALAEKLGFDTSLEGTSAESLGFSLSRLLMNERWEDQVKEKGEGKAGLVFLIDLGNNSSELISELLGQLIPCVQTSLRNLKFFNSRHNRFRVMLAGRYLAGRKEVTTSLPLNHLLLRPFFYPDLRDAAKKYLVGLTDNVIDQISAHILHITGGHPGCMAALLEMYRRNVQLPPDIFVRECRAEIQQIIEEEVSQVQKSIPDESRIMDTVGIFRYLNHSALSSLIDKKDIRELGNEFELADRLAASYLLGWGGRLLRNDSTHRLLVLRLRQGESSELAQDICLEQLDNTTTQLPEMWAIEYLYQTLHPFAEKVYDLEQRRKISETFLNEQVPNTLQRLVKQRNIQEERKALEQALIMDKEFRFTVNYYLRDDQYNDEPYQNFLQRVDDFFTKEIGENNA